MIRSTKDTKVKTEKRVLFHNEDLQYIILNLDISPMQAMILSHLQRLTQ